jgi:hypothetical protein
VLAWEVLPPGHLELDIHQRVEDCLHPARAPRKTQAERILLLHTLQPTVCYAGSSLGHRVYHVAVFDSVVLADCEQDGNALYYCSVKNWRSILVASKAEALKRGAGRIVHRGDWRNRVRRLAVRRELSTT